MNDRPATPEEADAVKSDSKWGWLFLIVLTLCITTFQVLELFLTGN